MTTHNARNERVKREYLTFLNEARRLNEASIVGVAAALHRFEAYTGFRDFRQKTNTIGCSGVHRNSGCSYSHVVTYPTVG